LIREIFAQARQTAPCVVFFDEIDAIVARRTVGGDGSGGVQQRVLTTLLNEMDGVESSTAGVLVIAATNRIDLVDPALLRPGRFDEVLSIESVPDVQTHVAIFQVHTRKLPMADDVDIEILATRSVSNRLSGADIASQCREAAMLALRADIEATAVPMWCFEQAAGSSQSAGPPPELGPSPETAPSSNAVSFGGQPATEPETAPSSNAFSFGGQPATDASSSGDAAWRGPVFSFGRQPAGKGAGSPGRVFTFAGEQTFEQTWSSSASQLQGDDGADDGSPDNFKACQACDAIKLRLFATCVCRRLIGQRACWINGMESAPEPAPMFTSSKVTITTFNVWTSPLGQKATYRHTKFSTATYSRI
jgi:hypothetical protein